jgi:hypothetical protein
LRTSRRLWWRGKKEAYPRGLKPHLAGFESAKAKALAYLESLVYLEATLQCLEVSSGSSEAT